MARGGILVDQVKLCSWRTDCWLGLTLLLGAMTIWMIVTTEVNYDNAKAAYLWAPAMIAFIFALSGSAVASAVDDLRTCGATQSGDDRKGEPKPWLGLVISLVLSFFGVGAYCAWLAGIANISDCALSRADLPRLTFDWSTAALFFGGWIAPVLLSVPSTKPAGGGKSPQDPAAPPPSPDTPQEPGFPSSGDAPASNKVNGQADDVFDAQLAEADPHEVDASSEPAGSEEEAPRSCPDNARFLLGLAAGFALGALAIGTARHDS